MSRREVFSPKFAASDHKNELGRRMKRGDESEGGLILALVKTLLLQMESDASFPSSSAHSVPTQCPLGI